MKIAVLLDLDNIKPKLTNIETICQSYGQLVERRAFSNTPAVLAAYGGAFRQFEYRFELTPGLNYVSQEVDHLIEKTACEILANTALGIKLIAIVSNDNGYASLFKKLKTKGIKTLVIGNQIGNQLRETADYVELLNEVMRPTYVGIDLGTTNTVMALANLSLMSQQWTAAAVEVSVKDEQGSLIKNSIISSSVRFSSSKETEIGGHIRAQAYAFRDQTILAWKHKMGCSKDGKPFYYELSSGKIAPEEAAAKVLAFCREKLLAKHGEVQGAVITHPASYESDAIEATRKAAVLAGWQEEEVVLLPEPQAALYDFLYRLQKGELYPPFNINEPSNILVYDLGGGTLDVTLHKVQWNSGANRFLIQDIAVGSRTRIGGDTIDQSISEYILKNSPDYQKLSEAEQKKLSYDLPIYAEKFKKAWGAEYADAANKETFKYAFQGTFLDSQFPIRYYITAERMREILAPLLCEDLSLADVQRMNPETAFDQPPFTDRLNTLVVPVLEVLLKAKQSTGQIPKIDAVLLNGGMTYFPPIRERLAKLLTNTPIIEDGNPDLAVARGAALFAAGALKPGEGVNPTNIYLEISEEGQKKLNLLVAQGQKYPYKTTVNNLKLPDTNSGYISFKAWVGMGTQPNVNTTLQRLRQVPIQNILQANLQPGCLLDLEVEYTFDERLLLSLVSRQGNGSRFKLEVTSDSTSDIIPPEKPASYSDSPPVALAIPSIPRHRTSTPITPGLRIEFKQWEGLATTLNTNWTNGGVHWKRQELVRKTALADNRTQLIGSLIDWLTRGDILTSSSSTLVQIQTLLAVMALSNIFQSLASNDPNSASLEKTFEQWIKRKFETGIKTYLANFHNAQIRNDLLSNIAETPGKLLWSGFDTYLIQAFQSYQDEARALVFLNSLAKAGLPTNNRLAVLHNVIKNGKHLGQREKAAWALGRLISPGQPEGWKATFTDVERAATLALDQLCSGENEPQVAQNLLGCLSQCIAWHTTGTRLSPQICNRVRILPDTPLAVDSKLSNFPHIEKLFEERLHLLPKMIDFEKASSQDISQMEEWLLESVKG